MGKQNVNEKTLILKKPKFSSFQAKKVDSKIRKLPKLRLAYYLLHSNFCASYTLLKGYRHPIDNTLDVLVYRQIQLKLYANGICIFAKCLRF
jgi:hypothetical protein